jgi:Arc/MetJ-type ribon-helix-helix transcriptional regulator
MLPYRSKSPIESTRYATLLLRAHTRAKDLARIENLIKAGEYTTKNEFIRFAVKQLLYGEERMTKLEAVASELQRQTKGREQVKEEIEEAKAETRKILSKGQ